MELNGTIFLQIFIFVMLLLWLSRSLFAPILRLFDERERRIVGAQKEAEQMNLLAMEKSKTFDAHYEEAHEHARHSLTHLKHEMEKQYGETLSLAKALAREKIEKAKNELEVQEGEIRAHLMDSSQALASDIVNTLLKRPKEAR